MKPHVESFFHESTFTATHLVWDPDTETCAIIDPVLDFDARSGRTGTAAADGMIEFVQ